MKKLPPLSVQVKRIIDQNARADWTSSLVWDTIDYRYKMPYQYNPEDAPKTPSPARIRTVLKELSDLGLIEVTEREGFRGYNTYERIIPTPLIKIEYRDKDGKWGLPILLFVGVCSFLMGLPL